MKTETKHTPGEWKIGESTPIVGITIWRSDGEGKNYRRICRNVACIEDARLIRAAPELLENLRTVTALAESLLEKLPEGDYSRDYAQTMKARAVIARTEGK